MAKINGFAYCGLWWPIVAVRDEMQPDGFLARVITGRTTTPGGVEVEFTFTDIDGKGHPSR